MKRALRKKLRRKFKVGDVITWGRGVVSHRILKVLEHGVVVDATMAGFGHLYVAYDKNNTNPSGRGPIRHSDAKPT